MPKAKADNTDSRIDFEKSLAELEKLVEAMESGDMSLEQSLQAFEQGMKLSRDCQQALASAEQKVRLLMEDKGAVSEKPYPAGSADARE